MHSGTDAASGIIAAACIAAFSCRSSSNTVVYVCVPVHVCVRVCACVCVCKCTHVSQRVACENPNRRSIYIQPTLHGSHTISTCSGSMALIPFAHDRYQFSQSFMALRTCLAGLHGHVETTMAQRAATRQASAVSINTKTAIQHTHTHTNGYVQIQ